MSLKKVYTLIERNMRVYGQRLVRAEAIVRFYKRYPELINSDQTVIMPYSTYSYNGMGVVDHVYRHRADNIDEVIDELAYVVRHAHKAGGIWFPTRLMYPTYLQGIPVFHTHYSVALPEKRMNENN